MQCSNCKEGIAPDSAFCEHCGFKTAPSQPHVASSEPGHRSCLQIDGASLQVLLSQLGPAASQLSLSQGQLQAQLGSDQLFIAPIRLISPTKLTWKREGRILEIPIERLLIDGAGMRVDFSLESPREPS